MFGKYPVYTKMSDDNLCIQISVDKEMVLFGSVCVGEVCKRTVTITNSGALPTTYHLLPAPLSPLRVSHH